MTTETARVSIVTPTFNRARLLPRLWKSLRAQTEGRFQWIVVDDGSTDDTPGVVERFGDERIMYVRQSNRGCNAARNRGEREIRAPYVIFLDSDDELYDDDTLRVMVEEMESAPERTGCVCFPVVDGEGGDKFSFIEADRVAATYEDVVCERRARGEFLTIYRRQALDVAPWPDVSGLEALRHWAIAKRYPPVYVRRPARIYHGGGGETLTSARRTIDRSRGMAEALLVLIADHQEAWLERCPQQYGRYLFYTAMYEGLAGKSAGAWKHCWSSLRAGGPRRKIAALAVGLLMPLGLRRKLFVRRAGRRAERGRF